ncbi:MAG: hypothetical protein HC869_18000 [Rhodospirillales bacterium]|nr:hypothetical protein [Rhodospirillales bacterium]
MTTPYGGGYFVRGNPYYGRYVDHGYYHRDDKRWRKDYRKKLKRYRGGHVYYHDHDRRCRHR